MRSVAEHQQVVAALVRPVRPTAVALRHAAGRVMAEDWVASSPLPMFDNSAMDGYALRAVDIAGAPGVPVSLPVVHDIPAGQLDSPPLQPGTAHRIMTGAPMPAGADTVVQVEATDGGTDVVQVLEARSEGEHVRYAGEDVRVGDTVLRCGAVLGPAQLGLLAALGAAQVSVLPAIRVLIVSTGSELVEAGVAPRHGQIFDANGPMLAAAVEAAGGRPELTRFVADDVAQLRAVLDAGLDDTDLIVTSGGVSAGAYEVVKDTLGPEDVTFAKVAMQPGMPQGAGTYRGTPIITLPGNPVSALVSFEVFVRPALRAAMGFGDPLRPLVAATLSARLESPAGRRQFRRATLEPATGSVQAVGPPASHFLRSLAASNCLLDIEEDVTVLEAGSRVNVWRLDQ
ncbi:MAG: molybdopterin molybdotransferase MoeA [Actinomycetota bacterium]|nr:molybdopterin molybdotransferase MoeA [Actinomycetota bacterium]